MDLNNINDIKITTLKNIFLEEGNVLHAMKLSDQGYEGFGEVYFSKINFKAVKAWKKHKKMNLNLVVPVGNVRFVFVNDEGSYREEIIGEEKYISTNEPISKEDKIAIDEINVNLLNSICQDFSENGEMNKILYLLNFIKLIRFNRLKLI